MNLCSWIDAQAVTEPGKTAIIFDGQLTSYSELADGVARLAAVMRDSLRIQTGDRVAWLGNNSPRIIESLFACARIGAILVPLNWRLAAPELLHILDDAGATLLIVGEDQLQAGLAIASQLENCQVVHAYGRLKVDSPANAWPALETLLPLASGIVSADADEPENRVLILYTSGTTGKPKGVVMTQSMLIWSARNSVAMHDMTASDHILMVLPMFHAGGFNIHTLAALSVGATLTLHEGFEPGAVLEEISSGRPTLTGLVPAQISAMAVHPGWEKTHMGHLRSVTTGSTYVPATCLDIWKGRGVTTLLVYGTTETCAIAICQTRANIESTIGSAGKAAENCTIRIADDNGVEVPVGEHGEILVQGPNVFEKYWRNPAATSVALVDGWLHTGDIGYQRPDGCFVIADRKADLIISGGENIYPAELEAILNEHSEISEAAVIGQPDERWGEVPVAFVVTIPASELNEEGVLALFKHRLARYKHPRRVRLVTQLPHNAMGKIEKFELRIMLEGEQDMISG